MPIIHGVWCTLHWLPWLPQGPLPSFCAENSWAPPRTVVLKKGKSGFGFSLKGSHPVSFFDIEEGGSAKVSRGRGRGRRSREGRRGGGRGGKEEGGEERRREGRRGGGRGGEEEGGEERRREGRRGGSLLITIYFRHQD